MFSVHVTGADELRRTLERVSRQAVPHAARDALNGAAFETRRQWSTEITQQFTTRNTFTAGRALAVNKARGTHLPTMQSTVGSTAEYMHRQEFGGTVRGKSGNRAIPGPAAAGQRPGSHRTRLVRPNNKLSALQALKGKGKSKRQRNAVAIAMAARQGRKHVVLERSDGGTGLFQLAGSRERVTTRLLWDFSAPSYRVPPHPTLQPALTTTSRKMESIMGEALLRQLSRHGVYAY